MVIACINITLLRTYELVNYHTYSRYSLYIAILYIVAGILTSINYEITKIYIVLMLLISYVDISNQYYINLLWLNVHA